MGVWNRRNSKLLELRTSARIWNLALAELKCSHSGCLGVYSSLSPPSPWRHHRTISQGPCQQIQLRKDDLPEVLRRCHHFLILSGATSISIMNIEYADNNTPGSSPTPCHQLQKEEVRPYQPAATEEETKVIYALHLAFEMSGGSKAVSLCFGAGCI
jgi:hypothetical protein